MSRLHFSLPVVVVLALSSCAAGPATTGTGTELDTIDAITAEAQRSGASESQLEMLRDGDVSKAELSRGFEEVRACLEGLGMSMGEQQTNPVDGWRLYADVNSNGVTDSEIVKKAQNCQPSHYTYLELAYEVTHDAEMDAALMAAVLACLRDRNIGVSGTERNVADLLPERGADSARASVVEACIQDSAFKLYPDAVVTVSY